MYVSPGTRLHKEKGRHQTIKRQTIDSSESTNRVSKTNDISMSLTSCSSAQHKYTTAPLASSGSLTALVELCPDASQSDDFSSAVIAPSAVHVSRRVNAGGGNEATMLLCESAAFGSDVTANSWSCSW